MFTICSLLLFATEPSLGESSVSGAELSAPKMAWLGGHVLLKKRNS